MVNPFRSHLVRMYRGAIVVTKRNSEKIEGREFIMRKLLFVLLIGMMVNSIMAQEIVLIEEDPIEEIVLIEKEPTTEIELDTDIGFYSAHVWRGLIFNDNCVFQPAATVSGGPLSFRVWANYDLDGKNGKRNMRFSETDLTLSYALPIDSDDLEVGVGYIRYIFPGDEHEDTGEVFLSAIFPNIILTPVASIYYDHDQLNGWYGSLEISQPFELSDAMVMTLGASLGAVDNKFHSGVMDMNVYITADYMLTDRLILGGLVQYSAIDGGAEKKARELTGSADNTFWSGIRAGYSF